MQTKQIYYITLLFIIIYMVANTVAICKRFALFYLFLKKYKEMLAF